MDKSPLERAFRANANFYLAQAELNEACGKPGAADDCLRLAADCENAANALRDMRATIPTVEMFQPR